MDLEYRVMHDRLDAVAQGKFQAQRNERRARGSVTGSAMVGANFAPRWRRSVAVVRYLSTYTVTDGVVVSYTSYPMGSGLLGSTFGFMDGGSERG